MKSCELSLISLKNDINFFISMDLVEISNPDTEN